MKDKYADISLKTKRAHLEQVKGYVNSLYIQPNLNSLFIEMTLGCNEHCIHCGSNCGNIKMKDQLTDQEILNFLKDLKTKVNKLPFLNITGGEPLIRPNFIELMHQITELGYLWGMTSNGILIDEDMVEKLRYAGMRTVSISIDGLEKSHDWFRNTPGAYKKSIKAIKLLVDAKFDNVMTTTVIHKQNIHELEEIHKEISKLGINIWRIINIEPIGRAKENKELLLNKEDYKRLLDYIKLTRETEDKFEVTFGCNHWLGVDNEHRFRNWYYKCSAGIKTASIHYNGDIGACLDIEKTPETIQGNIRKDDFIEVWENKFEIFRQNRANNSEYCKDCSEKEYCRGDGFHTWNLEERKPELCLYKQYCK